MNFSDNIKIKTGLIILFIFFLNSPRIVSQERFDFGGFMGASYYMGDINPYQVFYSPAMSFGGIIDYTFNTRYYLRFNVYKGNISGFDTDFDNDYQKQIRKASFQASLVDLSLQLGFNFMPYINITKFQNNFSFFVNGGIGYNFFTGTTYNISPHIVVPFGCGIKYNLVKRLTVGIEWTYRKTFKDKVDGVVNWSNKQYQSVIHNYDWYSFCGLFFTYKLFYYEGNCPVYWDD